MNPENYDLPDDIPRFDKEEKSLLKEAGFGALMPYEFARFRLEKIENVILRTKLFLRKQGG